MNTSAKPLPHPRRKYRDASLATEQKAFDSLVEGGADAQRKMRFIIDVFTSRNRIIRNLDWRTLNPKTIENDYLLPRKEIYDFVLDNWVRHIFLPELKPKVADRLLMFGLGRIFSTYNDIGVQQNTDADLNIVVDDTMSKADLSHIEGRLQSLARSMLEHFGIAIEINPAFTLLKEKTVVANLTLSPAAERKRYALFYKCNEKSIYIFKDHESIRKNIFSHVRSMPDSSLFEHFLGLGSAKSSFMKLRADLEPLPITADGSGERVLVRNVIGSIAFAQYCRKTFPRTLFISPPDWVFSMKYFVNRVYDYVCAMRNAGHGLDAIGFATKAGTDPEYLFLRNSHKLMLYFQELGQLTMRSYGTNGDFSYISRGRLLRFMEIAGDKFRLDFENMVIGGGLLQPSNKEKFRMLKAKIDAKARDRFIEGRAGELSRFPPGFEYETVYKDDHAYKICVPYSWADLGFFTFSVIASRIAQLVETRLEPAAKALR